MVLDNGGRQTLVGKGECVFIPRDHHITMWKRSAGGERYCGIFMMFTRNFLREAYSELPAHIVSADAPRLDPSAVKLPPSAEITSLFESMTPYFDPAVVPRDDVMKLKMREGLLALLHLDSRFAPTLFDFNEPWKIDILAFMNDNYMYELSIEELAHYTGRSPATFKRDFRKISDLTPAKVDHAQTLGGRSRDARHARAQGGRRISGRRVQESVALLDLVQATLRHLAGSIRRAPTVGRGRIADRGGTTFASAAPGVGIGFAAVRGKIAIMKSAERLNTLTLLASIALITALSIEIIPSKGHVVFSDGYLWTLFAVCIVYMADFFVRMASAASPSRYLRRNILILLLSIPYQNILHWATGGAVGHDLSIVLSAVTLLRAFLALYMIVRWLVGSSVGRLFAAYIVHAGGLYLSLGIDFLRIRGSGKRPSRRLRQRTVVGMDERYHGRRRDIPRNGHRQGGVRAAADARHGHVPDIYGLRHGSV